MRINVDRSFLEINSIKKLNRSKKPSSNFKIIKVQPADFQLNKFFYKQIGRKYRWVDRLLWTDQQWVNYISDKKLFTYILRYKEEIAGYFELILHKNSKEAEIAYFGILEEYFGKKLGGFLLSEAIKVSFFQGSVRVWVHTCSLDHKNALNNYLARGMKIFKSETLIQ